MSATGPYPPHGSLAWIEAGEPDYPDDLCEQDEGNIERGEN